MRDRFILYIDDCPEHLELVQRLLEHSLPNVLVETCCTSSGAEKFLNHRCYDVIICDVALPGELGTDIAAAILARDQEQPIYLMSEYTGENVKEDARRVGLTLHSKFSQRSPDEFVKDIKALMSQRPCTSAVTHLAATPSTNGDSADTSGGSGESAATDRAGETAVATGPPQLIRLTSPYVLAARASLRLVPRVV